MRGRCALPSVMRLNCLNPVHSHCFKTAIPFSTRYPLLPYSMPAPSRLPHSVLCTVPPATARHAPAPYRPATALHAAPMEHADSMLLQLSILCPLCVNVSCSPFQGLAAAAVILRHSFIAAAATVPPSNGGTSLPPHHPAGCCCQLVPICAKLSSSGGTAGCNPDLIAAEGPAAGIDERVAAGAPADLCGEGALPAAARSKKPCSRSGRSSPVGSICAAVAASHGRPENTLCSARAARHRPPPAAAVLLERRGSGCRPPGSSRRPPPAGRRCCRSGARTCPAAIAARPALRQRRCLLHRRPPNGAGGSGRDAGCRTGDARGLHRQRRHRLRRRGDECHIHGFCNHFSYFHADERRGRRKQ